MGKHRSGGRWRGRAVGVRKHIGPGFREAIALYGFYRPQRTRHLPPTAQRLSCAGVGVKHHSHTTGPLCRASGQGAAPSQPEILQHSALGPRAGAGAGCGCSRRRARAPGLVWPSLGWSAWLSQPRTNCSHPSSSSSAETLRARVHARSLPTPGLGCQLPAVGLLVCAVLLPPIDSQGLRTPPMSRTAHPLPPA